MACLLNQQHMSCVETHQQENIEGQEEMVFMVNNPLPGHIARQQGWMFECLDSGNPFATKLPAPHAVYSTTQCILAVKCRGKRVHSNIPFL